MSVILIDIISGISGDMTIAALIDAGASFSYLQQETAKLKLDGYQIQISKVKRNEISATKFNVKVTGSPNQHTHLKEIFRIIDESSLSDYVKINSMQIFETMGKAEAKIHDVPVEQIHFHEVGAVDSIIDIVGTCICLEYFKAEKIFSTQVKLGRGIINTQHGLMPNPAPATLEILKDYPAEFTDIDFELTTPTGAAIVRTLSDGIYSASSHYKIKGTGFGAGAAELKETPNLLRVILCESSEIQQSEKLLLIETNIDDMNPQIYPYLMEKLFEAGANDVYYQHITMKKGRPGILISILTDENLYSTMLKILYEETTTIGTRTIQVDRHKLKREIKEVDSVFGRIKVKVINKGNSVIKMIPEFEECKRLSIELKKPLNEIYNRIFNELNG